MILYKTKMVKASNEIINGCAICMEYDKVTEKWKLFPSHFRKMRIWYHTIIDNDW